MRKLVGISQKIKRAWLDAVLDRLVKTTDEAELRTFLDKHLKEELPGTESRAKTSGIILQIWRRIPPDRIPLRDRAVTLLSRISGPERIWLHWGMTALAYPFFRDTAEVIGRLLALQDDFTTAQVQGRLLTTWGDRATSKEAAQKLITTLVDWEVLRSTQSKGHFLLARKMPASIPELQLWLLEALLGASAADEIEAQQLLRLPESFPFTMSIGVADLRRYEGFNIHRQGLDIDMVALGKVKLEPQSKPAKKRKKETAPERAHPSLFDVEAAVLVPNNGTPDTVPVVNWAHHEDIGSGDVFEALHSGLTVGLISTPRDNLMTCTLDDAIADVIGRNIESYDFLPVVSQSSPKNASIIGLFHAAKFSHAASLDGCIREHYDPLSEEFVIGADARILDFVKDADHKPCRLVVSNSGIIGLVSLSDLQRLPVRAVLFSVITGFEITMMEAIRRSFPSDEDWLCRLSEGRRQKIKDTIAESHRGDGFVDALLFTQFCDKADIIRKSFDLGKEGGESAFSSKLKKIQSLRDHVAHANEYAASPEHAQNVCTLVRDIIALREKLAAIRKVGSLQ